MEIRLLGPFEVLVKGLPVAVPDRLRSLLAALALSPGRVVSVDALARAIWGEELPGRVKGSLQTSIMRLRHIIGEDAIGTSHDGYRLHADTDVAHFHQLLDRATAAVDDVAERALLAEAIGLWRGDALDGIGSPALHDEQVPLLCERFLTAVERRVDLDLAAGGGAAVCGELRELVDRFPLREPLWERLIRALAGTGRNAEALSAYARCRELFAEELGVEPGARLRQLHLDLLRASDGPAACAPRTGSAIPQPLTRLLGRDEEVSSLVDTLLAGETRWITLTGVAGIGKTRLAMATAHAAAQRGLAAWWVPLSPVPNADHVFAAIADGVEAPEVSISGLIERFGGRPALLAVDNLEHIDGVGHVLADLLTRLPTVRLLATSRAPAGIVGEQEWLVPPLPVPDDGCGDLDELTEIASVALFVDRVRVALPSFRLSADLAPAVGDICRNLHGLPLGLELAAGQWRVRGGDGIARLIRDAPLELSGIGGRHDHPHGSLRDAIAASYALLDDEARDALCRLAVFREGWTYDLAETAVGGKRLVDRLDRLVSLGLAQIADTAAGHRLSMPPTIQAFAAEEAVGRGIAEDAARRHAHAIRSWVAHTQERLASSERALTLATLDAERDNLLGALGWFKQHDPNSGLALIESLRSYWQARGRDLEGFECFEAFLQLATDEHLVAKCLPQGATLAASLGRATQARSLAERGLAAARRLGDVHGQVYALMALASVTKVDGIAISIGHYRAAVAVAEHGGDTGLLGNAVSNLGGLVAEQGDAAEAEALFARAIAISIEHDHPLVAFDVRLNQADLRRRRGDLAGARHALDETAQRIDTTGDLDAVTFWHVQYAVVAAALGDLEEAREHADTALALVRDNLTNRCTSDVWWARGEVALATGDREEAANATRQSLATYTVIRGVGPLIETLVGVADTAQDAEVAAGALAAATPLDERDGVAQPPLVARMAAIRERWVAAVGEQKWDALFAAAATRSVQDTLALLS